MRSRNFVLLLVLVALFVGALTWWKAPIQTDSAEFPDSGLPSVPAETPGAVETASDGVVVPPLPTKNVSVWPEDQCQKLMDEYFPNSRPQFRCVTHYYWGNYEFPSLNREYQVVLELDLDEQKDPEVLEQGFSVSLKVDTIDEAGRESRTIERRLRVTPEQLKGKPFELEPLSVHLKPEIHAMLAELPDFPSLKPSDESRRLFDETRERCFHASDPKQWLVAVHQWTNTEERGRVLIDGQYVDMAFRGGSRQERRCVASKK